MQILQNLFLVGFLVLNFQLSAQGPYAPAAGSEGSTAIDKDDASFVVWATSAQVQRGLQNISNPSLGSTTVGDSSKALGKADYVVVSLGDAGEAILSFESPLYNGEGPDFAVFENSFSDSFLELAFVEVSSDGINFFRFDAHSLTDTLQPVGSFGALDPTNLSNLAGKYRGGFGTPFDLEELKNTPGLDVNNVTHIKIIDVVGTLNSAYARRDAFGNKINDMYPTPFPSGGFDLDAVGAIYIKPVGLEKQVIQTLKTYPNPVTDKVNLQGDFENARYQLFSISGQLSQEGILFENSIDFSSIKSGLYFLRIQHEEGVFQSKIVKQ